MRSLGRWLVYTVIAVIALVFAWNFYTDAPLSTGVTAKVPFVQQGGGGTPPTLDTAPAAQIFDSVEDLWHRWSVVTHEARPQIGKVTLKAKAPSKHVDRTDYTTRTAFEELVDNTEADIKSLRKSHDVFLKNLATQEILSTLFTGYGVVIVGGGEFFAPAITTIQMLRRTGCHLPVEIFVAESAEYEEYICEEYLPKLNARCLILTDYLQRGGHKFQAKHYQLKSFALLFSSFQHVLFLDSDSMPIVDPYMQLMRTEPYLSKGMIIWPDFWLATESPSFYSIAGLGEFPAGLPKTSSETGQILINKGTHLSTILLANYYNAYGPDWFYPLLSQGAMGEGDKETFMAAATVLKQPFYRVKTRVEAVMNDDGDHARGRAMIQFHAGDDYSNRQQYEGSAPNVEARPPRVAFLHANIPKMNAGHLMDEVEIWSEVDHSKRWRLLGTKQKQEQTFGYDVEATLWELMTSQACELQDKLNDWKPRENLCDRIKNHVDVVIFGKEDTREETRPDPPKAKDSDNAAADNEGKKSEGDSKDKGEDMGSSSSKGESADTDKDDPSPSRNEEHKAAESKMVAGPVDVYGGTMKPDETNRPSAAEDYPFGDAREDVRHDGSNKEPPVKTEPPIGGQIHGVS